MAGAWRGYMAPGARSKFGLMFELELFQKQMYCSKRVLVTLLILFVPPTVIRRRGIVPTLLPSSSLCNMEQVYFERLR